MLLYKINILFYGFIILLYILLYNESSRISYKILLIINFAWKNYINITFLNSVYIPFFKKYFKYKCDVVYYGPQDSQIYNVTGYNLKENGYYAYKSLILAYEKYKYYYGYLYINDDGFLNPILFNLFDHSNIIIESVGYINTTANKWYFTNKKNEYNKTYYNALSNVVEYICKFPKYSKKKLCRLFVTPYIVAGRSDFFFIPHKNIREVVYLLRLFLNHLVFLECTIPTISQLFEYNILWKMCRIRKLYYLYTCPYIHPIKYSVKDNRKIIKSFIENYNTSKTDILNKSISEFAVRNIILKHINE